MTQEFIPYELAVKLKELGFDEPCFGYWNKDPQLKNPTFNMVKPFDHEWCLPAPLYQQAFRWFREKYNLYHSIDPLGFNMCLGNVGQLGNLASCNVPNYGTYEEAESACLTKLIEIVESKSE